jgi:hypothetical protein
MPNYNFNKDLPIARETEREVGELLQQKGSKVISYNNDNKYDILLHLDKHNKDYTVEVKEDFTCERTGNVGVEFSCRDKDSGIACSQANFYVYKIHEPNHQIHFYMMKTQDLKDLIKHKFYHRIVNGGDPGSNSMNYLFELKYIKQISILLK